MSLSKPTGIKLVQRLSHQSPILTTPLLCSVGIYPQLSYKYVQSGWLKRLGRGVFVASGAEPSWEDAVRVLQNQLGLQVHLGAKTTFGLLGQSQYLGRARLYLFFPRSVHIPEWFGRLDCLRKREVVLCAGKSIINRQIGFEEYQGMKISSLERAGLEHLHLVGTKESFDESIRLLEGLTALRSKLLQSLLEACISVKAKRLFLYIAEHLDYPWFRKLDLSRIKLGSGPRVIDRRGIYNSKYKIVASKLEP